MGFKDSIFYKHSQEDPFSSGKDAEIRLLGRIDIIKYEEEYNKYAHHEDIRIKPERELGEDDERFLMAAIEKCQPKKMKPFAEDLHNKVSKILNKRLKLENNQNLEYYTSVNTLLDEKGRDAFFKYKYKGEVFTVTIDLTIKNKEDWKAEVLIKYPSNYDEVSRTENTRQYEEILSESGFDIAEKFEEKIKKFENNKN